MKRIWKHGMMWVVTGLCCFATVAEVDAGIIFRRRPTTSVATTQTTTNVTRPRRGILGRRRGTVVTSAQVANTTGTGMTVRGQTPDSVAPATDPAPAAPAQPAR